MRPIRTALAGVLALGLGACGNPTIRFEEAKAPDTEGRQKYYFQGTAVSFSRLKDDKGVDRPATLGMKASAVPDRDKLYYMTGTDWSQAWGVSTSLQTAYSKAEPELLESIGTETKDHRVDVIKSIGGVIAAAAPIVLMNAPPPSVPDLPDALPITPLLTEAMANIRPAPAGACWQVGAADGRAAGETYGGEFACKISYAKHAVDKSAKKWGIALPGATDIDYEAIVRVGAVRVSAEMRTAFDGRLPKDSGVMPYSACRDVEMKIEKIGGVKPKDDLTLAFAAADPKWVETTKLLYKGTITLQSTCGASAGAEGGSAANPLDAATEALKQYKAAKDAFAKK